MAKIDIAYCEDCAAKHNLFRTQVKALKNCYLCGHARICNMHPYSSNHVKKMAAEEQKDNAKKKRTALALAEIKGDVNRRAAGEGEADGSGGDGAGAVQDGGAEEADAGGADEHRAAVV